MGNVRGTTGGHDRAARRPRPDQKWWCRDWLWSGDQPLRTALPLGSTECNLGTRPTTARDKPEPLFLGDPVRAWDLYTSAAENDPDHPLPRYYRGQGLLLLARLLDVYQFTVKLFANPTHYPLVGNISVFVECVVEPGEEFFLSSSVGGLVISMIV